MPPAPSEKQQTIDQILKDSEKVRNEFDEIENTLEDRRLEIQDGAGDSFTQAEQDDLKDIKNGIDALNKNRQRLALATVQKLNNAADVQGLINTMNTINSDLKIKLQNVERVAEKLNKLAATIKKVEDIAQGLIKLATILK